MRCNHRLAILCWFVLLTLSSVSSGQTVAEFKAVTSDGDNYPYNFIEGGQVRGLGYDVVVELARRRGQTLDIAMLPWARTLQMARLEPNLVIFTLARIPERESWFHWIGPIAARDIWLYQLTDRKDVFVKTIADVRRYLVGDLRANASISPLEKEGITPDIANADVDSCRKLKAGRIDLVPLDPLAIKSFTQTCGILDGQMQPVYQLVSGEGYYIGLAKNSDAAVVAGLQASLDAMKKDRTLQKIVERWTPKLKPAPSSRPKR